MRDNLIGYLLEALDPAERQALEEQLERDPQLRQELALMERSLEPLRGDEGHYDPPPGLTRQTCAYVANYIAAAAGGDASSSAGYSRSRWRMADFVVAAGICFAASMLFFSAVNQSRFRAHLSVCQNNLRQLGVALTKYSSLHGNLFPAVSPSGNAGVAGIYGPKLIHNGFLTDPDVMICPGSALADEGSQFQVPTLDEVERADAAQVVELHRRMGGSYAYNLGYMDDGRYRPTKNLRRPDFALMADAPGDDVSPHCSPNHGGCGQNVLFEDGHVAHLKSCKAGKCGDDIYLNDDGVVAAGSHSNDAVVGASSVRPVRE